MDEQIHIIITSDQGRVITWLCRKNRLRMALTLSLFLLIILFSASILSFSLFQKNRRIDDQMVELHEQLRNSAELYTEQKRRNEEQRLQLNLQLASLELDNARQAAAFRDEKETLISTAVSELNERSELIEKIVSSIGIEVAREEEAKRRDTKGGSGGPFVLEKDGEHDELLFKADNYLKTIQFLPFGKPLEGEISSRFGKRQDPVNGKTAFHTGVDFRSQKGDKIHATADGVVKKAFRNGGYGNYLLIDHGNGYQTGFGHLHAFLVRPGEQVKRGQIIALVGDTGRSTGAHLHYEISLNKKFINPYDFMQLASAADTGTN